MKGNCRYLLFQFIFNIAFTSPGFVGAGSNNGLDSQLIGNYYQQAQNIFGHAGMTDEYALPTSMGGTAGGRIDPNSLIQN